MSRYEVCYFGEFFWGDKKDWWNIYEPYDWNDAWNFYSTLKANGWPVYIKDNVRMFVMRMVSGIENLD